MGKDKEPSGKAPNPLEELLAGKFERRPKEKKERKKSSKRERSREKSKSQKRHRKRSEEEAEEEAVKNATAVKSTSAVDRPQPHHRKRIRWVHDDKMFKTRYFRVNDEPIADGLTDTQMMDIRDRLIKETSAGSSSQIQARSDNTIKSGFSAENIAWTKPKSVFRGDDEYAYGKESKEKKQHEIRISTKIACYFPREYQIPDKPSMNLLNNNSAKLKTIPKIKVPPFSEQEFEEEEIRSTISKQSYLTEQARKQLGKKLGKSNVKKVEEESEKSDYSDYGAETGEIDQEDDLLPIAQFAGMMGQCFSDYKSYIKSLRKKINALDENERERVKQNIDLVKSIFESNSKVLAVNSNKSIDASRMHAKNNKAMSNQKDLQNVNKNYRTKHCRNYHSENGCGRGEACHFIHDPLYKGRPVPEPDRVSRPPMNANPLRTTSTNRQMPGGFEDRSRQPTTYLPIAGTPFGSMYGSSNGYQSSYNGPQLNQNTSLGNPALYGSAYNNYPAKTAGNYQPSHIKPESTNAPQAQQMPPIHMNTGFGASNPFARSALPPPPPAGPTPVFRK